MTEAPKKGKGLRKDSDHWNLVKEQIANKEFAIADTIPAKRILEFNETEKNWPKGAYTLPAFAASLRNLVAQLRTEGGMYLVTSYLMLFVRVNCI